MRKILIAFSISLFANMHCFAQNIIEPETCILSSIGKGSQPKSIDTNVIRFNCIKQFHKSAEPKSVPVNKAQLSQVTLEWFPKLQTLGPPYYLNESVRINLKNNSSLRLIYVSGSIISDTPVSSMDEFAQKYSWVLISVHGLPK
jgi:hypothetical protein